jgi:hypothetical protein
MLVSVILGRIFKRARQTRKIMVNTIFRLSQKNRRVNVLFDIDIEDNFIFQRLTVEVNLLPKCVNRSEITIDEYKIYIYGRHQLPIITIDFYKK